MFLQGFYQNRNPNTRYQGGPAGQTHMQNAYHRNPYSQQPTANGVNPQNGIIVDGGAAQHINGDASPNLNVDPYNGNADDLQSQQPPVCSHLFFLSYYSECSKVGLK